MTSAHINATDIAYEIAGAGFPLVFIHAGITDSRLWDGQFSHFAERYRVLRYDMRGFGQTAMPPAPFNHLDDLSALLAHLDIQRAYLLGCSRGGLLALDFALAFPDKVAGLVLVNPAVSGFSYQGDPIPELETRLEAVDAAMQAGDVEQASELEVQIWVDGLQRTSAQVAAPIRDFVREMNAIALRNEALASEYERVQEWEAAHRITDITAPTLLIEGGLDLPTARARVAYLAENLPNARRVVMPETAHLPNLEDPTSFNQYVLEFLETL